MDKEPAATAFEYSMTSEHHLSLGLLIVVILAAGFIAITFIQSGLDKVFDYKGNLGWIGEQFSKTFLKSTIGILLPVIMIGELAGGLLLVYGVVMAILKSDFFPVIMGFSLCGMVLLMLLFGQRVSKQYAGAVGLTGYFLIVLAGLIVASLLSA
jgi:uncharacterized membrane protein YphA (DoxX/SURF4 family)